MPVISEEYYVDEARVRLDCYTKERLDQIVKNTNFLTYIVAGINVSAGSSKPKPDIIWHKVQGKKNIKFNRGLELYGDWSEGEVQKLIVSVLRRELELADLYAFHAAVVKYKGTNIMFMTGEENHGKTMSLIECCRRGGRLIGAESIICEGNGDIRVASKRVFLESNERSKGTERVDKPSSHRGVEIFFGKLPDFNPIEGEKKIDIVVLPDIDGNYDTFTAEMGSWEKEYQTFQCLSYFYWLSMIIASGLPMPIIDNESLRDKRAKFTSEFTKRPYFFIRGSGPQIILDEVEKIL